MLALDDNPAAIFPEGMSVADIVGTWRVVQTLSRSEKAIAHALAARTAPYFLPMVERTIISAGKKRKGMQVLYPGYVFFAGELDDLFAPAVSRYFCRIIPVPSQSAFVADLVSLQAAILAGRTIDRGSYVAIGAVCRIACGPMEGTVGTVTGYRNGVAKIEPRGLAFESIEVDAAKLEPV